MEKWSLEEVEAIKDSPGRYYADYRGNGSTDVEMTLILQTRKGGNAQILSVALRPRVYSMPGAIADSENGTMSPAQLRAIPYGRLTAMAEPFIYELQQSPQHTITVPLIDEVLDELFDFDALRKEWPKGDINKVCTAVAHVYNSAIGLGNPPKNAVADAFSTSLTTAGRMIAKARELGILNVSSVGGRPKAKGTDHGEEETTNR